MAALDSRADQARRVADRVIHAPAAAWQWVTDPVHPERVGEAVMVALLVGAAHSAAILGLPLAALYLTGWMLTESAPVWRRRRRERKQARADAKAAAEQRAADLADAAAKDEALRRGQS